MERDVAEIVVAGMQGEADEIGLAQRVAAVEVEGTGRQAGVGGDAGDGDIGGGVGIALARRRGDGERDGAVFVDVVERRGGGERGRLGDRVDGQRNVLRRRGGDVAAIIGAGGDVERDVAQIVVAGMQGEADEIGLAQRVTLPSRLRVPADRLASAGTPVMVT